jgi:16S rRNA (guanine1516-N2)-methyltransferase
VAVAIDLTHPRRLTRADALVRALGWGKGVRTVIDATAGLGRDAAALARMGFAVTAIERVPVLIDAWRAAMPAAPRGLTFCAGDACEVLLARAAAGDRPDAIYLDPMYAEARRKSAPRKDVVRLRAIVGDDADAPALLEVALRCARARVVVKRSRRAPPLGPGASHAYVGASTRFDLYLVRAP